jgi:hypothetical protein
MGLATLLVWIALVLLTMLGTIITGLLALFLRTPKRLVAIDALLVLATILIGLTMCTNYLPTDAVAKTKVKMESSRDAISQANLAVHNINQTIYSNELPEPVRSVILFESKTTLQEALKQIEKQVQKSVDKYPVEPELASRLAIIQHYENTPTEPTFEHYYERGGRKNFQLDMLRELYNKPELKNKSEYIRAIDSQPLSDWYHQTALIDVYKV